MKQLEDLQKALEQKSKIYLDLQIAYKEIFDKQVYTDHQKLERIASLQVAEKSKWVSVEDVTALLQKVLTDQTVKEQALRKQFQELFDTIPIEMEKVGRKYEVYSIGTKKQWIEWLVKYSQVFDETFPNEEEQAKVSVDRKQLSDLVRDSKEVYDELDASDVQNYILIMAGQLANNLNKLLAGSGEHLNLALAFSDVKVTEPRDLHVDKETFNDRIMEKYRRSKLSLRDLGFRDIYGFIDDAGFILVERKVLESLRETERLRTRMIDASDCHQAVGRIDLIDEILKKKGSVKEV